MLVSNFYRSDVCSKTCVAFANPYWNDHRQQLDRQSGFRWFSYGYWKCMCVDSLYECLGLPDYLFTLEIFEIRHLIFDWCVVRWGSENRRHSDACLKGIGLHLQNLPTNGHSIENTVGRTSLLLKKISKFSIPITKIKEGPKFVNAP